jgi:hypothetical protein
VKNNPGVSTGILLGSLCTIAGIGFLFLAPAFSGFFDRGHDSKPVPFWIILLILAAINYIYGFINFYLEKRSGNKLETPRESADKAGRTKQE